jgi:ribosomal protein S27AE
MLGMSLLARLREQLAPACDRCGGRTVVERERLLATVPTLIEETIWCPRCGETVTRPRVVDTCQ